MSLIVVNQFSDEFYVTRSSIHFAIFDHNLYLIHVQAALSKIWVFVCYSGRIGAPNTTDTSRLRQLLDLEEVKWGDDFVSTDDLEKEGDVGTNKRFIKTKQTSLSDFFN